MTPRTGWTTGLIDRMQAGDVGARNELIAHTSNRLQLLAAQMLRGFPGVGRQEEPDDVLHNTLIRLMSALAGMPVPESSAHWWNLAARHLRWELIDLARHYGGPQGPGAKHYSDGQRAVDDPGGALEFVVDPSDEPATLEAWERFHQAADRLPQPLQGVFDLIWYHDLTHEEAAAELGVSLRTIGRLWRTARLSLGRSLREDSLP